MGSTNRFLKDGPRVVQRSGNFPASCLTIGTSDSSGGAGVQADIKTFAAQNCYGASVVVALSAQNFSGIKGMHLVPESFVRTQLDAVGDELPISAIKIGLVPNVATIRVIGRWLRERPDVPVVLDPVAADSRGIPLLQPEMVGALCDELMPRATVATPNRFEAALLAGMEECLSLEDMEEAAQRIFKRFGCPVVVTGGGLAERSLDVLAGLDGVSHFDAPTCHRIKVHGAGCAHSAAITAGLAKGDSLREAIFHAKFYVSAAIAAAPMLDSGRGALWHGVTPNILTSSSNA
ncbi:MAG: bifunctional hydroxymethylpyrimidine kinase/phosphomethylpyrimidine kinase [Planctomycetes bacterium]|nr:bifunctional hydroxymethylpyrimidine kinase/phosphomethylpyrimidine kinase [Planctomycetota bacterium]